MTLLILFTYGSKISENYFDRSESYIIAMVEMFKRIPQNFEMPLTSREKNQKLMIDIGGGWYLKKCERGYHH